jgi:hypothetical protein
MKEQNKIIKGVYEEHPRRAITAWILTLRGTHKTERCCAKEERGARGANMARSIFYIIGIVVVVLAILSLVGLR